MNTTKHTAVNRRKTLIAMAVAFILVVASTIVPIRLEVAAKARLDADKAPAAHRVYRASGRVGTAATRAQIRFAQDKRLVIDDVLFTSGRSDLEPGAVGNLNRLVNFLGGYPDRRVALRGYTDSLGREDYNQGLSERRAHSVQAYLAAQGIDSTRLSTSGMGPSDPVAGNDSGDGRQQNRRVEVTISKPPAQLRQQSQTARMIVLLALLGSVSGSTGRPLL